MVRGEEGEGNRPRHPGQRSSAGHRHRPAAQWAARAAGILGIENVGGDIDKVTGRRCTFALFPWNWERGDGCIIRLVAITDPKGAYRIEKGEKFA
jgi:kynurenine formamidase